jgi:hypothetical protein
MSGDKIRLWITRLLIALVTAWNLQAALVFILWPETYAPGFELSGVPGAAAVRGVGILFVMWNVPYLAALWNPVRYRLALILACVMQAVGLIGESFIWLILPLEQAVLHASIFRFIMFDGVGLILLLVAIWVLIRKEQK